MLRSVILFTLILLTSAESKRYKWNHIQAWSKKPVGSKVLIVYTGGTIGMKKTSKGLAPQKGYMGDMLRGMPELQRETVVTYDIIELDPLLDSSSMSPSDWKRIGDVINTHYANYDGFVVLHGTDTMAYTSSALSFMFENLDKTIVVTGSQIPISEAYTDAKNNLISALNVAAHLNIPEVVLVFGGVLLRGNRVTKTSATSLKGFTSPNYPAIARKTTMKYHPYMSNEIAVLTLYPGISGKIINSLVNSGIKGLVIQAFGEGNAPETKDFSRALEDANKKGVILVDTTQCGHGNVNMESYAAGSGLKSAGVVNGRDMTLPAAFTKLSSLIGRKFDSKTIKEMMGKDIRGEMTVPMKDEL
ncbi:asparaginase [Entamoeba marina]